MHTLEHEHVKSHQSRGKASTRCSVNVMAKRARVSLGVTWLWCLFSALDLEFPSSGLGLS